MPLASKSSKNGTISKTVNRKAEIQLKPNDNRRLVTRHPTDQLCGFVGNDVQYATNDERTRWSKSDKENDKNPYTVPRMNSTLGLINEMKQLNISKPKKISSTDDLTPRSKALLMPQISKRLNFPPDKPIFRNLISLNVNDSMLLPENKPSLRKKYIKAKSKTPVPELADFLKPLPPLKYIVPEPDLKLIFSDKSFDYFSDYREFNQETDADSIDVTFKL